MQDMSGSRQGFKAAIAVTRNIDANMTFSGLYKLFFYK